MSAFQYAAGFYFKIEDIEAKESSVEDNTKLKMKSDQESWL
jgi:hypothetical protein